MKIYDDTSWHLDANYPAHLPKDGAATPMGMFFAWVAHRGWVGAAHLDDFEDELESQLLKKTITPGQYLLMTTAGDLTSYDFNDKAAAFANAHYSTGQYQQDLQALCTTLGLASVFELPDTWDTFASVSPRLDARYAAWQAGTSLDPEL